MAELAEQIDSHVVVIDVDNSVTNIIPKGQGIAEVILGLAFPTTSEISLATLAMTQVPFPWRHRLA